MRCDVPGGIKGIVSKGHNQLWLEHDADVPGGILGFVLQVFVFAQIQSQRIASHANSSWGRPKCLYQI